MDSALSLGLCLFISFETIGMDACLLKALTSHPKENPVFISTTVFVKWSHRWTVFISLFSYKGVHAWCEPLYRRTRCYLINNTEGPQWEFASASHRITIRQARKLNAVIRGCGCCMRVGTGLTLRSVWRSKMETFPQHYRTTLSSWCHSVWFDGPVTPKICFSNGLLAVWW